MSADRDDLARPAPSGSFRESLRERLRDETATAPWRPSRPGVLALAYIGSGAALLAVAALGAAGIGPLS